LVRHEKVAFLKFFITYFISVALLILAAGFFYFSQIRDTYLKSEEFSLIEYARHIKMGASLQNYDDEYHYNFVKFPNQHIDIRNFTIGKEELTKYLPMRKEFLYLQVHKKKRHFTQELWALKKLVIMSQIILLILFAILSYILAKNALKPLQESISKLDKFAKDLIHDLNTPVTSIKLNMRLIEKIPELKEHKAINRLNRSVHDIAELHGNLTILLQEETFQMSEINICDIVQEVVEIQRDIYGDINFFVESSTLKVKVNQNAMKQILQNIISNACKYNSKNGYVKIYTREKSLFIEDSGKGIQEPEKIFERSYSAEQSSGIGLDIVKRLSDAMEITIDVKTSSKGSIFILHF